jgi:hypothetical protein
VKILVVEPSMFRRAETYVLGPYPAWLAWLKAHLEVRRHPFGEVSVVSDQATVTLGDRVLWAPRRALTAAQGHPYRLEA